MKLFFTFLLLTSISIIVAQNPVNFDSCFVLQPSGDRGIDAEVFSCTAYGYDTTNFGDIEDFCATDWTRNSQESIVRSLIYFDLSGIPSNKTINAAKLTLYFNPNSAEGQHSSITGSNTSEIQRIITPWNEHSVNWNNQPQITSLHQVNLPASTSPTQDFIDIDITQLVIDSRNNPSSSFGFLFRQVTEQYYRKLVFASSDHPTDSLHPKLVVCFSPTTNGMDFKNRKFDFSCFPNPAKEVVNLHSESINGLCNIKVMDVLGKVVFHKDEYFNKYLSINVSHCNSGVYFVIITNNEGYIERKKIIIE